MRKSLGIGAIIAGLAGLLGSGTIYLSLNSNITVSVFILLCALFSLALGIVTWRQKGEVFSYAPLLAIAGIAGAVFGMTLIALALK